MPFLSLNSRNFFHSFLSKLVINLNKNKLNNYIIKVEEKRCQGIKNLNETRLIQGLNFKKIKGDEYPQEIFLVSFQLKSLIY